MAAPLAGKCILDLGAVCGQRPHALAVSMAAKLCVDYGARVVRLIPAGGDPLAHSPPLLPDERSALDIFLNRGKEHDPAPVRFDAAIGDGAALAKHAAGIGVLVRLSVFGAGEDPAVSELALAALSGLLDIVGDASGPPTRLAGHQLAYAAGLSACTALLAALHAGGSDTVDVSLFDVAIGLNGKAAAGMLVLGTNLKRGNARNHWGIVPAQDGYVALVYQEKDWPALCEMVGDARLNEPQFASIAGRAVNRAALMDLLRPWFANRSRADITQAAQRRRIPIGPVLWPAELLNDAQYRARGFLQGDGMPGLPLIWDGQRIVPEVSHAV
jgi:crotonobetainyl-CoA:carnitine CoA-transferase CaiB-like acyl-CoA transferase